MHQAIPTIYGNWYTQLRCYLIVQCKSQRIAFFFPRLTEFKFRFVHDDFFSHFSNPLKNMVETLNLWRGIRITDEIIFELKTDLPDTWGTKVFEFLLNTKALMILLNLSLRTPLKYQHLASKYGGQFFRSRSNYGIFFLQ